MLAGHDLAGLDGICLAFAVRFVDFDLGDLRFRHRQRHVLAGRDHVEFARNEHREATGMANAAGDASGVIAGSPVEVGARRSHDRRSRVLRNHQPAEA